METVPQIKIREIKEVDFSELLEIYNNSENMKFILTGKSDYILDEIKSKWNELKFNSKDAIGFRVVELENKIIGECALLKTEKPINEEVEIAYLIDKKYWKKGYGTKICKYLISEAFEKIRTEKIIAGMYAENTNSSKLLEKLNFSKCNEGISCNRHYLI